MTLGSCGYTSSSCCVTSTQCCVSFESFSHMLSTSGTGGDVSQCQRAVAADAHTSHSAEDANATESSGEPCSGSQWMTVPVFVHHTTQMPWSSARTIVLVEYNYRPDLI